MSGIRGLRVDVRNYSGEINITSEKPQAHLILSSDTLFLDRAYSTLEQDDRYFTFSEGEEKRSKTERICFLRKQENLVDGLTVAENLFLSCNREIFISYKKMIRTCERIFEEIGYYLPPNAQVSELTSNQRRFVEFYRIYLRCPAVLVANEVTVNLSYKEIVYFSRIVESLKSKGTSIFFFTTRCEEALRIGDVFHIYVDGERKHVFSKLEVQNNPEMLFLSVMNITSPGTDDMLNERQWLKAINESMQIENQITRINMVLSAYCNRIRKLMEGQFCRLYLYQSEEEEFTCAATSEELRMGFGYLRESELRKIVEGEPLFIATERDCDYAELFETEDYPRGTVCYSMNAGDGNRLLIQVGMNALPKYIKSSKMDMLQHIAIELLIFIENSRLHRQTAILQESNHRIKNNMQMILSYLMLQHQSLQKEVDSEEDRERVNQAFQDLTNRIMVVYNVHNLLSAWGKQRKTAGFEELLHEIRKIYENYLDVALQVEEVAIPQKIMLSLGIILNEMMNNTVKHNLYLRRKLHADIQMARQGDQMCLSYRDDGAGDRDANGRTSSGIGMWLIKTVVQNDLKGEIHVDSAGGYAVKIRFPIEILNKNEQ